MNLEDIDLTELNKIAQNLLNKKARGIAALNHVPNASNHNAPALTQPHSAPPSS